VNRGRHLMQGTNWVKYSDEAPPSDTEALCCDLFTGEMFIADMLLAFTAIKINQATGFYRGNRQGIATHWMPLPPMPEGE
ncbi:hypothetical protein, partial [Pseudomonas marginalis]|uniref:hypothetical protein n=1 Tax=Pseudomonas marginalis TaxID=298 RepID=UPI002B1E3116